jgi:hypothetical protein
VGFYIRTGIEYSIVDDLSIFIPKTFECLTIETVIHGKRFYVSSVYRSPTAPAGRTPSQHLNDFTLHLDTLLTSLSSRDHPSYICLDANINQLALSIHHPSYEYFSTVVNNGFTQCISKATRIVNKSYSLIDHIPTNSLQTQLLSGTILSDISDHFMTFVTLSTEINKQKNASRETRNFSSENLQKFKTNLQQLTWDSVLQSVDVNDSYNNFWTDFKQIFDLCFPVSKPKFNKNLHKINKFMTQGLLISRMTKLKLHKVAIQTPSTVNLQNYRCYRNVYNRLVRASRKWYFDDGLKKAKKDPKKTWKLINEALNRSSGNEKIEKISVNGNTVTDQNVISNTFNEFFINTGKNISNSVPPTNKKPEDFLPKVNAPDFFLGQTSQAEVVTLIRACQSKMSSDIYGITMGLLKFVALEIGTPLAHIFNLVSDPELFRIS